VDTLASAIGITDSKETTAATKPAEGGNFITRILEGIGLKEKTAAVKETAEKERASVFGEFIDSGLERLYPNIADLLHTNVVSLLPKEMQKYVPEHMLHGGKLADVAMTAGDLLDVVDRGPEAHPLQHEIESLTAFSIFIPDFLLCKLTDRFQESQMFQLVVDNWPLMPDKMKQTIKSKDYDPDDLINVLRVMNQDLATGKVTIESVIDKIKQSFISGLVPDFLKDYIPGIGKSPKAA
jgi:hypothetical protein